MKRSPTSIFRSKDATENGEIELPPHPLRKIIQSRAPEKAAILVFSAAVLLAGGAGRVGGQSALDGFDPNVNGTVLPVVVQADGRIPVGWGFTTLSANGGRSLTRSNLTRLNPDGTLDAWSAIPPPYPVSGTNNAIANATAGAQKFYRLSKP
jgi:hypothetical protein